MQKHNYIRRTLLVVLIIFISIKGNAQTFVDNFITYNVTSTTNNTVEIVDYDMAGGSVVNIPSTVISNSITYEVTDIGNEAFFTNQLTQVTIPNGIITIGALAFSTNQITAITIPPSVTTIGNNSFELNQLTTIVIPDTVTSLGSGAFANNLLTSATISNGITSLLGTFTNNNLTSINIPNTISSIGDLTFFNNQLTDLIIPSSVANMGAAVFRNNPLNTVSSQSLIPATIVTGGQVDTFGDRSNVCLFIPPGTTDVYVTNTGALWTDFKSVVEDPDLSTEDVLGEKSITISRTTNRISILYPEYLNLENWTLFSTSGHEVSAGVDISISTETIAKGLYILQIRFDQGIIAKKVLIL